LAQGNEPLSRRRNAPRIFHSALSGRDNVAFLARLDIILS
jgi:hypothetical protein